MNAEQLAAFHESTNEVLDGLDAYREALLHRGYSPTAAEQMAVDWHRMMLELAIRGAKAKTA